MQKFPLRVAKLHFFIDNQKAGGKTNFQEQYFMLEIDQEKSLTS